ncbi:MAG: ribonuclease H-like domain-containing protein [Bacillota bacterium]|nr:ribonuclease H-like domain-containing protein [Bacillota bacterium]
MDLWERFRQFQERAQRAAPAQVPGAEPAHVPGAEPARTPGSGAVERWRRRAVADLGLQCEETPAGPSCFLETFYPATHRHGILDLGSFLNLPPEGLGILAQPPQALPPSAWAFLDTETTGLQGGPGTIVFLCGLARFAQDTLVVRQYLAPDPAAEPALIWAVLRDLAGCQGIVSFNGRAFDWPLIRDRVVLARQSLPPDPVHADLLFPARWLFRSRLASCRLTHLESEILRCPREGDIPSELIPEVYRAYLRGAPARTLAPVLDHNRHDLLSLVVLACRLLAPWLQAEEAEPEELYGLARMMWARGHAPQAVPLWEKAVAGLPPVLATRAGEELGRIYRHLGQPHEAARIWRAVAPDGALAHPGPLVELAKYYEHVVRDHEAARQCTLRALEAARHRAALAAPSPPGMGVPRSTPDTRCGRPAPPWSLRGDASPSPGSSPGSGASVPELLHRLRRLERKLAAHPGPPPSGD